MGADVAKGAGLRDPDETVLEAEVARAVHPLSKKPGLIQPLRQTLQDVMWDHVGVMRTAGRLENGRRRLGEIRDELMEVGVAADNLAFNLTWHDWLNTQSLIEMSQVITEASIWRENSRGAHFREDFPEVGDLETSYFTLAEKDGDGVKVTREDVKFTIVKPGETILPEGEPDTLVAAE
jgi:fumarate reductase flavoprotein subunit